MSQPKAPASRRDGARREFLAAVVGAAAVAVLPRSVRADDLPALTESDPTASALGYKDDASKVDAGKFPQHKAGQHCAVCSFYQGAAARGPCSLFPGKSVAGPGWCSAFAPKA